MPQGFTSEGSGSGSGAGPSTPPGGSPSGQTSSTATKHGKKPIAVVVSGLGDNRPNAIIRDLESRGYVVQYFTWHNLGSLPPVENIALAIGHSAGATRVELEYGTNKSDVRVISLDSPTRHGDPSVVEYHSNILDPVSALGSLINPGKGGGFINLAANPHNKNDAYKQVEWNE